jgi:RHH-type proline utilization regulon transcriptional repressor/proline dehydrogenase/delta 1-pyrroline-5-carboxylate dehydrogenase
MVRLVKGAYWDSEIKRAQVDGLEGYPVYTRKVYTDVSYVACARKLLAVPDAIYPQFATHNAHTLAAIYHSPARTTTGQYEFQCLHGMGEPLYDQVVGAEASWPSLPHLRAGRHARNAAGLPGAPPAGKRRQHLVRQPHRRPVDLDPELVADPVASIERWRRWKAASACRTAHPAAA